MRILVYNGKHGDEYWMADTPEHTTEAQAALFKMLDEEGCYAYGDINKGRLKNARDGDAGSIARILQIRNGYEYETWSFEEASVPG
jgi:hypothetical protein